MAPCVARLHVSRSLARNVDLRRLSAGALLWPIAAVALLAAVLLWQVRRIVDVTAWVDRAGLVISRIVHIERLAIDLETSFRGYLLNDDPTFLDAYGDTREEIPREFERLLVLVADDPAQVARVHELRELHARWLPWAAAKMAAHRAGAPYVPTTYGKSMTDAVRARAAELVQMQETIRQERHRRLRREVRLGAILTLALGAAVAAALAWTSRRRLQSLARAYDAALADQERTMRDREEFLSIAAHELRTPLTALRLAHHQLDRALADPGASRERLRERAGKIDRSLRRLAELTEHLLEAVHLRTRTLALAPVPTDLVAVIERVLDGFGDAGAAIRRELPASTVVPCDGRIEIAIRNVVANALKYGSGRPIAVSVGIAADRARVVVTDQGIGIANVDRERIFEAFGRAVPVTQFGGFGVGLWAVRRIVEAHGGTVHVESEVGRGSAFTIDLPAAPATEWRAVASHG
jgi:two-component system sensor kinase FixL